jgi:hypothetical protein
VFKKPMARLGAVLIVAAGILGLCVFTVASYLRSNVPSVNFSQEAGPVNLTIQTVGAIGFGPHPTWVSYLVKSPAGKWIQSTMWTLPANRLINVTVQEYDSGSAFRNDYWGGVTGTVGGVEDVNGKAVKVLNPTAGNGIAHSFNVPDLGINVPFYGVSSNAKNPCGAAPCQLSSAHNLLKFSFRTPPGSGNYHWQCFVPCGLSYLYGNGGPMQAIGNMGGFLKVVTN